MLRFLRYLRRLSAFRIGLGIGLLFSLAFVWQLASRKEVPVLTRLEAGLEDLKFKQRGVVPHEERVVIAAVDEAAIARFGRFPWDRRVIAQLVDKLAAERVAAMAFDIEFSDQDLGAQFAGAKRFRSRFSEVSLAEGRGKIAVDRFDEAASDVSGAASALEGLKHELKPGAEPIYRATKGRLDDGRSKLIASGAEFLEMQKRSEAFARELEGELRGTDPDQILGRSLQQAGNVVMGFVALTEPETRAFSKADIEEGVQRIARGAIAPPVFRLVEGSVTRDKPVEGSQLKNYAAISTPLLPIAQGSAAFGFFNTLPDEDGVIRNTALAVGVQGKLFPSLDAMLVATRLGIKPERITPLVADDTGISTIEGFDFDGKLTVPTDARGLMRINYYGGDGTFTNYSVADIIGGKTPPGALKDKLVIIGVTAQGTFDQRVTPFQKITAGVETHANAVQTMLDRRFLRHDWMVSSLEVLFLFGLALLLALLFAKVRVGLPLLLSPLLVGAAIWGLSTLLFRLGYAVFAAMPLVEMGSMFVVVTVFRFFTEERDKRQLRKAFQLYLNPDVMEEMLAQPDKLQLGGVEREISCMFSDIRGFTTLSEKLTPQQLVHVLNEYLTPMTDIVFARRGTLDKYIGDAVMAFFGAPIVNANNALDACEAALDMMESLARLRERWHIEDPNIPDIDIGIGINSGPMVVGNMGSTQRFNYTVMGDNVNLASRLEGLNKEYRTHILISQATLDFARRAGGPGCLAVRELDWVKVKGKDEPVTLFELRGRGAPSSADATLVAKFAEALALYRQQKFAQARALWAGLPDDGPSALFVERCDELLASPPAEGWNGVFKMEHK